jgi:hypothetical protein
MPILRLLKKGSYEPNDIQIMTQAFEEALRLAGVSDRTTIEAESIARRVIRQFEGGVTDPALIAREAADNTPPQSDSGVDRGSRGAKN